MIITDELAQKIVDTIMPLVHRNVNIFNQEGIIIATGHPHRYKSFHKGAKDVIDTGSVIEIYPNEIPLYPGALQGVNLPIVFDGQTVGVVGVFGNPDEVRSTGRLTKAITELFLERELTQKELRTEYFLREKFIDVVISNTAKSMLPKINRIAKTLGLKLELSRAIVLIDLTNLINNYTSEYGSSELVLERTEKLSIQKITEVGLINETDIAIMLDKKLLILKYFDQFDNKKMHQWAENVLNTLSQKDKALFSCGIGAITSSINEYHDSYEQAKYCLIQCKKKANAICTIYDKAIIVHYALHVAADTPLQLSLKSIVKSFFGTNFENAEMKRTILALLENNLNINVTADYLHIHRNTLIYRLTCLKNETGLDPAHLINDAILCRLLLNYLLHSTLNK